MLYSNMITAHTSQTTPTHTTQTTLYQIRLDTMAYTHTLNKLPFTKSNGFDHTHTHTKLEMCSIAQEGERASPAQGSQLIVCHFLVTNLVDKHAHILVKSLPNYQELVHISVHKCIPI